MNFLFVIDNLGSGGAQRQMVNLARGLEQRGHSVEFFVYYPANHYRPLLDEAGIQVHLHRKSSRFSLAPLIALRRLIQHRRFHLVLSFLDTPNFYAEVACTGVTGTKLVVSERFMYPPGPLSLRLSLLQRCHRLADFITVNSHHQRERMVHEFPWMMQKIQTIYNGFDLKTFCPIDNGKRNNEKHTLLAISSVAFKKNSLNLARALAICKEKYHLDVYVDWVGTHQISGEGIRPTEQTNDYLEEAELTDNWNWLGERTDIPQMLANHDALIHPSFFEGLPNVICEALACGRPVLASDVCDHVKLIQEGISGFLFDPHAPESIARAIASFYRTTPEQRLKMGAAARDFAEKNLSLDRYVDDYENLFMSIMANNSQ
jgi:glycosyltransferase involved in cell wall biosynthesis